MSGSALAPLDAAGRAELSRLLAPIVDEVSAAVLHPPAVARGEWMGPASRACEQLEGELRQRLGVLLAELDRVLAIAARAS